MGACRSQNQIILDLEEEVKTLKQQKENLQLENRNLSRKLAEMLLQTQNQENGCNYLNTLIRSEEQNTSPYIEPNRKNQLLRELLEAKKNSKGIQDNYHNYLIQQYLEKQSNYQNGF